MGQARLVEFSHLVIVERFVGTPEFRCYSYNAIVRWEFPCSAPYKLLVSTGFLRAPNVGKPQNGAKTYGADDPETIPRCLPGAQCLIEILARVPETKLGCCYVRNFD